MIESDEQRAVQLKLRVWGIVARNLLMGREDPYVISESSIEAHRGRIDKALRLVAPYIHFLERKTNKGGGVTEPYYKVLHFKDSKEEAEEPEFNINLNDIHKEVFGISSDNQEKFNGIGYRTLDTFSSKKVLYTYWHKQDYDLIKIHGQHYIYPKSLNTQRIITILRAIVEQHLSTNYHAWLEKFIGLPGGSMKTEDTMEVSVRNFAAHSYRFSEEAIFGKGGHLEEYQHFVKYFQALTNSLIRFNQLVADMGGYDTVLKTYRKDTIERILEQAALYAFIPKELPYSPYHESLESKIKNPYLNNFILKHSKYFNYDTLYGADQSILVTGRGGKEQDTPWEPDQQELNTIKGDATLCTQTNN